MKGVDDTSYELHRGGLNWRAAEEVYEVAPWSERLLGGTKAGSGCSTKTVYIVTCTSTNVSLVIDILPLYPVTEEQHEVRLHLFGGLLIKGPRPHPRHPQPVWVLVVGMCRLHSPLHLHLSRRNAISESSDYDFHR